jgi:hypothetical protein
VWSDLTRLTPVRVSSVRAEWQRPPACIRREIGLGLALITLAVFRFAQGNAVGIIEGLVALAAGSSGAAFGVLMLRAERER